MSSRSTSLREHGYPYAKVSTSEDDGADGKQATVTYQAEPGPLAHFGPIEISQNTSVSDQVIRRQLTFKPGDLYRRSVVQNSSATALWDGALPVCEHRDARTRQAGAGDPHSRHCGRRQTSACQLRSGLRHRGKCTDRQRISPCELSRRRPLGRRPGHGIRASTAASALDVQPAVFFRAADCPLAPTDNSGGPTRRRTTRK